jgi:hypothetical protein
VIPIGPIVVIGIRLLAGRGLPGIQNGTPQMARSWRLTLYGLLSVAWGILAVVLYGWSQELASPNHARSRGDLILLPIALGVVFGASVLFFSWPILRRLVRRLHRPKLVYYLAHLCLICPFTGEAYAGASLLALLALAHRGNVKKEELDWFQARLSKERRHLGTYATACALHQMLTARIARDERRFEEADVLTQRARTLLVTTTYLSSPAIPKGVRKLAYELIALDNARRGQWGMLEGAFPGDLTPLARVIRAFWYAIAGRSSSNERERKAVERFRRKLKSPILDRLYARSERVEPEPTTAEAVWTRSCGTLKALLLGETVPPRAAQNMLAAFDVLLDPSCPATVLPEAIRDDDELVDFAHEEIAKALVHPVLRIDAPLHAMPAHGPISARVYQDAETALSGEVDRALAMVTERLERGERLDPFSEWCQVSHVRSAYHRLGTTIGPHAVAQIWPNLVYVYCKLGVDLSEKYPRMRPLAHAVFRSLWCDATRFEDRTNIDQQLHNMNVTAGVE